MARLFRAVLVVGASVAIGAGVVAVGCGESRRGPSTPDPLDAANEEAGSGAGGGSSGSAGTSASAGGRGGNPAEGGTSGLLGGGSGGVLEPGESAQWNCDGAFETCQGTTAGPFSPSSAGLVLTRACAVESQRPRTRADCEAGQRLACDLAVNASGAQLLVNCECQSAGDAGCGTCASRWNGLEVAADCSTGIRVCPCANTGRLR